MRPSAAPDGDRLEIGDPAPVLDVSHWLIGDEVTSFQADHIYVVDALFDNVQVFNRAGEFLLHWGSAGRGLDQFWLPTGIAIHDDQILVADSFNRRIQRFHYVGQE